MREQIMSPYNTGSNTLQKTPVKTEYLQYYLHAHSTIIKFKFKNERKKKKKSTKIFTKLENIIVPEIKASNYKAFILENKKRSSMLLGLYFRIKW